jgi:Protein of unknown function (DUF1571)
MNTARDHVRSLSPRMVACLGLSLCLVDAGCSGISGLRSVGTERPSLLSFWDRQGPGSPTPENDAYAKAMRPSRARAEAIAKQGDAPAVDGDDVSTNRDMEIAATAEPARRSQRPGATNSADPSVRVSLGAPEPLPEVALADVDHGSQKLATAGRAPSWKPEKTESSLESVPPLSQPVVGDGINDQAPASVAEREQVSAPAESSDAATTSPTVDPAALIARAEARLDGMKNYKVKITRLERVNGQLQPEEDILLSIRRDPKAVRLEWSSGPSKGREVIYSSTIDPRMIFVHMPAGAIPLPVMRIPVDSPLVMRNSRHAITEAGFDTILENLRKAAGPNPKKGSDSGELSYRGLEKASGLDRHCHHFVRKTPSGENWNVYLDPTSMLPRMVLAEDSRNALIERYNYREIHENPDDLAAAGAFEPDQRWGESKGLLSRLARAASNSNLPATNSSTTR